MAAMFGENDILSARQGQDEREEVILAGVWRTAENEFASEEDFSRSLEELEELAKACRMEPVHTVTQKMPQADRALYVHRGKADEIAQFVRDMEASRVIFNDSLSPSQIRNLQKVLKVPVTDRTRLILEIFETRARTREAKLQVELAKLRYLKPRLTGLWETQNRQGGASGAMSSKGEGEKQLEIDRRTIDHRLSELRRELALVGREREIQRRKRTSSHLPLVALVGYTNAGKSTLLNAMIAHWVRESGAEERQVFAEDMLFATLDTSVRRITVERGREFLLSDTVGFIRNLPAALVEAFHSTLEEVTQADLLLQVVDASDPYRSEQMRATEETIRDLGAGHIPMVTVFNKCDKLISVSSDMRTAEPASDQAESGREHDINPISFERAGAERLSEELLRYPRRGMRQESVSGEANENIYISARDAASVELLTEVILEKLESRNVEREFRIPYEKGSVQSYLSSHGRILETEYREDGAYLRVSCAAEVAERAEKLLHR